MREAIHKQLATLVWFQWALYALKILGGEILLRFMKSRQSCSYTFLKNVLPGDKFSGE